MIYICNPYLPATWHSFAIGAVKYEHATFSGTLQPGKAGIYISIAVIKQNLQLRASHHKKT